MPESILRRTEPDPAEVEAGQAEPLLAREREGDTVQEDHRKRFWSTLGVAAAVAVFLIFVFGYGGAELSKRRWKLPGGPG